MPDYTEAKAKVIKLLEQSIKAHEEKRFTEIGSEFEEVYDYLTDRRYKTLREEVTSRFNDKTVGDAFEIQEKLSEEYMDNMRREDEFQKLFHVINLISNWMDSAGHDWGYGDESEWIPQAESKMKILLEEK